MSPEQGARGVPRGHVKCVPKRRIILMFAQVRAVPATVCKTAAIACNGFESLPCYPFAHVSRTRSAVHIEGSIIRLLYCAVIMIKTVPLRSAALARPALRAQAWRPARAAALAPEPAARRTSRLHRFSPGIRRLRVSQPDRGQVGRLIQLLVQAGRASRKGSLFLAVRGFRLAWWGRVLRVGR
jgi:hypothetical protein